MAAIIFFCTSCGHESGKWLGQCPGCGEWNSFAEQPAAPRGKKAVASLRRGTGVVAVTEAAARPIERIETGLEGLDRVLGGGLVPGSLVLLAGEPGIGKSTLLLQVAAALARNSGTVVYITGETELLQYFLYSNTFCFGQKLVTLPDSTFVLAAVKSRQQFALAIFFNYPIFSH